MRNAFFGTLEALAEKNKDIYLLTADLGFKLFDSFRTKYPERFVDVGIAESNMVSLAAGMSLVGKNVYCYSMVPFLILRAYEQIRIDVAYHNLNVKLVGVGGGIHYGLEGFTHFGVEDLALMRALPNMTIISPADAVETKCAALKSCDHEGPLYIRLGGNGEPPVYSEPPHFEIGKAIVLQKGKDIALFATGSMVHVAKQVADLLSSRGICATLINIHTMKPLDIDVILDISSDHGFIFSLEEHSVVGGLGSAIAEVLSERGYAGLFKRLGLPHQLKKVIGKTEYLRDQLGLSPEGIASQILIEIGGDQCDIVHKKTC